MPPHDCRRDFPLSHCTPKARGSIEAVTAVDVEGFLTLGDTGPNLAIWVCRCHGVAFLFAPP